VHMVYMNSPILFSRGQQGEMGETELPTEVVNVIDHWSIVGQTVKTLWLKQSQTLSNVN
jgi:hypothetical protein